MGLYGQPGLEGMQDQPEPSALGLPALLAYMYGSIAKSGLAIGRRRKMNERPFWCSWAMLEMVEIFSSAAQYC
jgi:hypothetical protein